MNSKAGRFLAGVAAIGFLISADRVDAEALFVSIAQVASGLTTLDTTTFVADIPIDLYEVSITNPNSVAATALELSFAGPWLNNGFGSPAFRNEAALPVVLAAPVAESYFVLPSDASGSPIAVNLVDTDQLLSASYTLTGGQALIEAGEMAVAAVLSAPAGTNVIGQLGLTPVFGAAVVDGVFECVGYPGDCFPLVQHPEPSAWTLAGLALLASARRRV